MAAILIALNVISLIVAILLYIKQEEKDEKNRGWKVVGYYILSMFHLQVAFIVLPFGALITLFLALKAEKNKKTKLILTVMGGVLAMINLFA